MAMWSFENFGFVRDIRTKFQGRFILDLYLIIVITVLMLALTYTPIFNDSVFRAVLAFPVTLFVPGYVLVEALFPRKKEMGNIARMIMSFGLSLIIVPLIGMALNYTPWGVRLDPILACVTIFTIACSLLAVKRRFGIPQEELFYPDVINAARTLLKADKTRLDKSFTIAIVIALLISGGISTYLIFMPRQGEQFTEFYILGPEHTTSGYPDDLVIGGQQPVIVCIANHERRAVTYDMVVTLQDNNSTSSLITEHLVLEDNQTWEKTAMIKPDRTGDGMRLHFSLYADGNMAEPYQECRLWINVTEPRTNSTAGDVTATAPAAASANRSAGA